MLGDLWWFGKRLIRRGEKSNGKGKRRSRSLRDDSQKSKSNGKGKGRLKGSGVAGDA
jgi:hypothetical protein